MAQNPLRLLEQQIEQLYRAEHDQRQMAEALRDTAAMLKARIGRIDYGVNIAFRNVSLDDSYGGRADLDSLIVDHGNRLLLR